jgi:hypothetical protein
MDMSIIQQILNEGYREGVIDTLVYASEFVQYTILLVILINLRNKK